MLTTDAQYSFNYMISRVVSTLSQNKRLTGTLCCFLGLVLVFLDSLIMSSNAMSIFFSVIAIASLVRGLVAI